MKVQNQANRRSTNNEKKQANEKCHRYFLLSLWKGIYGERKKAGNGFLFCVRQGASSVIRQPFPFTVYNSNPIYSITTYETKILRFTTYQRDTDRRLPARLWYWTCQTVQRLCSLSENLCAIFQAYLSTYMTPYIGVNVTPRKTNHLATTRNYAIELRRQRRNRKGPDAHSPVSCWFW